MATPKLKFKVKSVKLRPKNKTKTPSVKKGVAPIVKKGLPKKKKMTRPKYRGVSVTKMMKR